MAGVGLVKGFGTSSDCFLFDSEALLHGDMMPLSVQDIDYVRSLVRQRSGLVLESEKAYLVEARLLALARRESSCSVEDLMTDLRTGRPNGLQQKVVEAMTTNETFFFRDVYPFEHLRQTLLPDLLRRRAGERCLNIWCAACASGQEPYSIAMLLRESFPVLNDWKVRLIASDLSTEMLERTRRGRYSQMEVNRGLPARLLVKYFEKQGAEWQIKEDLRRQLEVYPINLIGYWPPLPPLDVVFLRNVLIYVDVSTKKEILGNVRRVLRNDGQLFLGGAETTFNLDDGFERVGPDRSGCYQLRSRVELPARVV
jgi:chemotaxis protein methyltransferase CheR